MTALLKLLPAWLWWLLAVGLVAGLQQLRVTGAQAERDAANRTLETRTTERDNCRTARASLEQHVAEQNQALADFRDAELQRLERARRAQADAQQQAQTDYQAANRLQQERTGGEACAAAESIIDQELEL
ncbi:hypothetical protein K7H92_15300 [Pseudomonas stutzeri]|nr:hypothetical protein [Stutzerimonas stutzeri]